VANLHTALSPHKHAHSLSIFPHRVETASYHKNIISQYYCCPCLHQFSCASNSDLLHK